MGEDNAELRWSGLFTGASAHQRARYLDTLRVKGGVLKLAWAEFLYQVVIREFHATYERFYQIPYSIVCEVVTDQTMEMNWIFSAPIDRALQDDMRAAYGFGDEIGDGALSALLGALDTAIKQVSSFAQASQSVINSVLQPLAAVQARVRILTASVGNTVRNVGTFGGVLPGNRATAGATKLLGAISGVQQSGALWNLTSVLGRMGGNLGSLGAPQNTRTVAGGNLFHISEQEYGDVRGWTTIARANKTTDPFITGAQTLTIPPKADDQGGVLQA